MTSSRARVGAGAVLALALLWPTPSISDDAVAGPSRTSVTVAQRKPGEHRHERGRRDRRDGDEGLLEGIKLADYLLGLGIAAAIGAFGGLIYATLTRPTDSSQE